MLYQEKRTLAFLSSTIIATPLYAFALWLAKPLKFGAEAGDSAFWARAMLGLVLIYIALRVLITIAFAIDQQLRPNGESVELEDELDRLIDLKATRVGTSVFMLGLLIGLLCLASGLPAPALLFALALSMPAAGIAGDLATLLMYRRGL